MRDPGSPHMGFGIPTEMELHTRDGSLDPDPGILVCIIHVDTWVDFFHQSLREYKYYIGWVYISAVFLMCDVIMQPVSSTSDTQHMLRSCSIQYIL